MNQKRLFVAINLPEEIKEKLFSLSANWLQIPAKWIKKENLHITLFFLGYFSEKKISDIKETIKKICQNLDSLELKITKVEYFPSELKVPKMIWVKIDSCYKLLSVRNLLKKEIEKLKKENLKLEKKDEFIPHITLARINQFGIRQIDLEEIPLINQVFNLKIKVNTIELMESQTKREGVEYTILESFPLNL